MGSSSSSAIAVLRIRGVRGVGRGGTISRWWSTPARHGGPRHSPASLDLRARPSADADDAGVRVHGGAAAGVDLEVHVGRPAGGVARGADVADHGARAAPAPWSRSRRGGCSSRPRRRRRRASPGCRRAGRRSAPPLPDTVATAGRAPRGEEVVALVEPAAGAGEAPVVHEPWRRPAPGSGWRRLRRCRRPGSSASDRS